MRPKEMSMKPLSDYQMQYIREHIRWSLDYLKGECVVRYSNPEHNLKTLDTCLAGVLEQVVECLPYPTREQVKRLLDARQRICNELNSPNTDIDL